MHPNPVFHSASDAENLAFARQRGFGLLSINGEGAPLAAHVPFVLAEDGASAELHLMRANPVARALTTPLPALLAVSGPDGYVSPDWYGAPAQVPTWNYVAVYLRGRLELLADSALAGVLERLSATFEDRLDKAPWRMDKVPAEALARMMRVIQPLRFHVESVEGTWKLSQNKPAAARAGVVTEITGGVGQELAALAGLMGNVSP